MQPYLDPTRKTTSQKNKKNFKKIKMEDDLNKKKMEDDLNYKAVLLSLFNNKNLKNKWL
jgi:hypothetical protein